jgi:hypothetical protein
MNLNDMKHVNLDTWDEAIKQFVLSLSVESSGSVLELNGREVLRVIPVQPKNGKNEDEDGWQGKNCCPNMAPTVVQALEAFRAALPELLQQHPGQWVAYFGTRQLGLGKTKTELFQQCLRQGLQRGEFIVRCIEPESDEQIE